MSPSIWHCAGLFHTGPEPKSRGDRMSAVTKMDAEAAWIY
jgi:hypothetical protein